MTKQTKIIIGVTVTLVIAVGVFAYLNAGDLDEKKELEANAEFKITIAEESTVINMEQMLEFEPVEITAIKDTSDTDPVDVKYTGVEFSKICEMAGIELEGVENVEFRALDGYSSSISIEDIESPDSVYIVFEEEGESLGTKSDGGQGPYMMINTKAKFSQSWCKYLEEAVVR